MQSAEGNVPGEVDQVHVGLVGLGKMGFNMRERMRSKGLQVTGYDRNRDRSDAGSIKEMAAALPTPRVVWMMVPAGPVTTGLISDVAAELSDGDLIIDGGNSKFTDDARHRDMLAEQNIKFIDVGVSGGIWGGEEGYAMMAGGEAGDIEQVMPVFDALRPEGERELSFVHAGRTGAGHYAKMVHNGIEYGLMQSFAEGYEILMSKDIIDDVHGTFRAWQNGTVVRSWLLDLLVKALEEDPELSQTAGYVEDSGEGRWTVEEAIEHSIPAPAITAALFARFSSRQDDAPAMKAVAALRHQFGGHAVRPSEK
ncbi:MAG TPA: decarboxylating 6-phosphogluconate dehydrogenase [Arthrobacter sp.]|nr:decarboxylating 6-phosphogluconate dehydrogenase [Arthrobacter sp.]